MWSVIKWKELNKKTEIWDVFYAAVPDSWLSPQLDGEIILMWPLYASAQKDRKRGISIRGKSENSVCTVIEKGFQTFEHAAMAEKKWHSMEKSNCNLTTDAATGSDSEDDLHEAHKNSKIQNYNELAEEAMEASVQSAFDDFIYEDLEEKTDAQTDQESGQSSQNTLSQKVGEQYEEVLDAQDSYNTSFIIPQMDSCISCSSIMSTVEDIKKRQQDQQDILNRISSMLVEQLEYIRRLQSDSSVKDTIMPNEKALEVLKEHCVHLPINSVNMTELVESLLEDQTLKRALKSVLYEATRSDANARKNFSAVINKLFDIVFLAKNFTVFGTAVKKGFLGIFPNGINLICDVLKERKSGFTFEDTKAEVSNFFKHSNQVVHRKEEMVLKKAAKNPKPSTSTSN